MRNRYLENLSKIEFVLTDACTGKCKHCSEGNHDRCTARIDTQIATDAVRRVAANYDIETLMVFGGEPLLYPEATCSIIEAGRDANIPHLQIITNGYFSHDEGRISEVARALACAGVNDLLLSVDAFHQEYIPLEVVKIFAREIKRAGIPLRLQPAWLVDPSDDNPYNRKTREILESFEELSISKSDGNIVFPEGNAKKYLSEYFADSEPENPYVEDPCNVKCLSFSANGDVLYGNVYTSDIMDIIKDYAPQCECEI